MNRAFEFDAAETLFPAGPSAHENYGVRADVN